jgi:SAM-dependent methyltransferase
VGAAFHELKFLARETPLGSVLTLGRQNLNIDATELYVEDLLLREFGATSVESIDYSDFEGATYIGDLNEPLDLEKEFDTILDFGTTEHVFNVPQAFKNCIRLCKLGGKILHSVPSNGECGHGFWQMSPELFFRLYSGNNGFTNTQVLIADLMDERYWWEARPPKPGHRLLANSITTTYVLVRTTKIADLPLTVTQADYEHAWNIGHAKRGGRFDEFRNILKRSPLRHAGSVLYRSLLAPTALTRFNPYLKRIRISSS